MIYPRTKSVRLFSSFFAAGYFPVAPGTAGSFAALVVYVILLQMGWFTPVGFFLLTMLLMLLSIWLGNRANHAFGRSDPKEFVLDEVAGMFLTFCFTESHNLFWVLILGFILFRLFDIVKPFIIHEAEKLPGGLGITLDDILAGLMANGLLQVFFFFLP